MNKRLFLFVLLCAVLSFSSALAEDGISLGCGPARIQLPPGYSLYEKPVPGQPRLYASDDSKTIVECYDLTADYSEDSFPLYENEAGLMQIMLHFKTGYEADGFAVSFSSVGESAALIVKDSDVTSVIVFHQYGIAGIYATGEQKDNVLNEITVETQDYRNSN